MRLLDFWQSYSQCPSELHSTPVFGSRESVPDLGPRWSGLGRSHSYQHLILVDATSVPQLSSLAGFLLLFRKLGLLLLALLSPQLAVSLTPAMSEAVQVVQRRPGGIVLPGLHTDRAVETLHAATLHHILKDLAKASVVSHEDKGALRVYLP